jgi:hypothetical protein
LSLHANYIVRESSTIVDIFSPQDVVIREHYVITVFNDKGDAEADHAEYSSQLTSIESLSGCIYDADGEVVKKIKKSDFSEVPASFRAGEFSDAKFKVYHVAYRQYPYTVEYIIKTRQNHTFYLPVWQPQAMKQCAVQSAEFIVTVPDSIHLKYKQFHFSDSPVVSRGAVKKYKWSLQNIHATKPEAMSYVGSYTTPTIIFAIDKFMLDNYAGSTSSWADFGAFVFRLNKGRDSLPDDVKSKIKQMVASASIDRENDSAMRSTFKAKGRGCRGALNRRGRCDTADIPETLVASTETDAFKVKLTLASPEEPPTGLRLLSSMSTDTS